ncbi:MAG: replication-associated recombination protein A [Syntrophomonas sp.]|uniref:replication-associated recombination protein A n=1 Tax=Syntrophomonas sp. TaxID=2053627 RepID=UPI00261AEBE8|nr:replication-associated recombination protein A [Syntrophomonas sp.]MDD2510685.1 replication-associated recombination protein A [Syntrophomonas sp.]MDD3878699.1 replication-associated recombination protein A [Syntrophomonas sp.]MDD4626165.1 replication-associated recombination protein A [Syntrophomonas sp.]
MDLFSLANEEKFNTHTPLAWRMRPRSLDEVVGQEHIIGPDSPLRRAIENDRLQSFVLYGPPGSGKTTIAYIIAHTTSSHYAAIKAVSSGVSEIRRIAGDAADRRKYYQQASIIFVDEIHRFNKSQQDVLLPYVEDGTLILIGATTENPLYEMNNALLSRMKLYVMEALNGDSLRRIVEQALSDPERGLGQQDSSIDEQSMAMIVQAAQGDARTALNILDTLHNSYSNKDGSLRITPELLEKVTGRLILKYDRSGDYHYDTISAFIKSIRGSDPDAALFWLAVMLEGGEDPKFIARRLIVHAAEDIGLADPYALTLAASAARALEFVGMPEARIPLAEATIYLAAAPKSNSSKVAIDKAIYTVHNTPRIIVPAHIADSSHSQSASLGKGKGYKYPHDYGGYVEQEYLPQGIKGITLYEPGKNGYEQNIQEFLQKMKNSHPHKGGKS